MDTFLRRRAPSASTDTSAPLLLLDDDSDALAPLTNRKPEADLTVAPVIAPQATSSRVGGRVRLVHPALADSGVVQRAVDWVCDPAPTLGLRRVLFVLTGINFGPSRRERDLRLLFCALYHASYDYEEPQP